MPVSLYRRLEPYFFDCVVHIDGMDGYRPIGWARWRPEPEHIEYISIPPLQEHYSTCNTMEGNRLWKSSPRYVGIRAGFSQRAPDSVIDGIPLIRLTTHQTNVVTTSSRYKPWSRIFSFGHLSTHRAFSKTLLGNYKHCNHKHGPRI